MRNMKTVLDVLAQTRGASDEQMATGALISLVIAAALLGGAMWVRSRRNELDRIDTDALTEPAARELAAKRTRLTIGFWVLIVFGISIAVGGFRDFASVAGS